MTATPSAVDRNSAPEGFRRRRAGGAGTDLSVGMLFWLTMLFLGGVSLGCIALGLTHPEQVQQAEKRLQADGLFPKLNTDNNDRPAEPASAEPQPSAAAPPDHQPAEPPQLQTELPPEIDKTPVPSVVDPAPVLRQVTMPYATGVAEPAPVVRTAAAITGPEILLQHDPTSGDTPMTRTWKTLALASLLVAASPTFAPAGDGDADAKALRKSVDALRKTVEALAKKVDDAPVAMSAKDVLIEINRLEKSLATRIEKANKDVQTDLTAIKQQQLQQKLDLQNLHGLSKKVEALETSVATINEELKKLNKRILPGSPVPTPTTDKVALDEIRTEMRTRLAAIEKLLEDLKVPNIGGTERKSFAAPIASNVGRVMLTNLYGERMLFVVNGRSYAVDPGATTQLLNMPVGALTYDVFADGYGFIRRTTTAVESNQTVMITVR